MSNTFRYVHKRWFHTPGAPVASGALVDLISCVGIAVAAIAQDVEGIIEMEDVHEVAAPTDEAWDQGDRLYLHTGEGGAALTKTPTTGDTPAGTAAADKAQSAATGLLDLNFMLPIPLTVEP